METMYFVLGVLSIIGAIALATIVWGVLKIAKLLKAIKNLEEWIQSNDRNYWDQHRNLDDSINRRFDGIYRSFDEFSKESSTQINDQITDAVTQSYSYTDKRIDRLIDTYFDVKEAKKLIKG
jgi:predicted PurR-regulated permease PerM